MSRRLIRAAGIAGDSTDHAILIENGKIAAIGKARSLSGANVEEIAYPGSIVCSPMHDHHFHPIGYAGVVTGLSLKGARDMSDLKDFLREAANELEPGEALIGNRLDDEALAERRLPTSQELDVMVGDRPVLLYRYCGHVAVVNSRSLELAGLGSHPTGVMRETEVQVVSNAVAKLQPPLQTDSVRRALIGLAGLGLLRMTAIVSTGEPLWCGVPDEIGTLIDVTDGLPIDFQVLVIAETPADLADAVRRLERASSNVSFFGWKEFADGSLGGRTAALYEPYSDDPGNTGTVRLEPDKAQIMAKTALDLGGVVAIHAIGDLANDLVIDVFEQFINDGADPTLLRIEHASMLTDTAVDRMAQLGVTASVQPAFLTSEIDWLGKRLGPRTERAYALARMHEAGIHLLGGSDCPVESPNPWWGMSSAAGQGRLAPREAFGLFAENLRVGAPADFLIVPFDPLNATPDQLRQMTVEHVYKNGNEIPILPELPFT